MKRPLLIVLCGMLVPISQTSCFPQVAPQTPCEELSDNGDSLRILTLNTALLGDVAQELLGALDPVPYDNDERGCNYANRLLEQDYDIIVLNEVFDENGRDALYNGGCNPDGALAHAYPYVVKKIENGSMEDSGLMLFSRYPFWELRPHDYDDEEIEVYQHGNAVSEPEKYVASIQYEACYDTHVIPLHGILINAGDCNADKAVALVKIFIPHT